eukprot:COSAG04_NODE_10662_length_760_cov_5.124054_1_plen_252_part_11
MPVQPSIGFVSKGRTRWIFAVDPAASEPFYDHILGTYTNTSGLVAGTEVDHSNWHALTVPALFAEWGALDAFWGGMAAATRRRGVSLQYCMSLPAMIMAALRYPAVTNARASPDNTPVNEARWQIGYTSMFMWPLRVAPFADNVWTAPVEPANPYGANRTHVELQVVIAVLTRGPFGFADSIDDINATRLWPAVDGRGRLVHAAKPATPIDAAYFPGAPGDCWQAHSTLPVDGQPTTFFHLLAIDVPAAWPL